MKMFFCFIIIFSILFMNSSCNDDDVSAIQCSATVDDLVNTIQNVGSATLERNGNQLSTSCTVNGLTPSYVYTLWWVVWNKSENCAIPNQCTANPDLGSATVEVELMYADGQLIGSNGIGSFTATLTEGDVTGSINDLIGKPSYGGLQSAQDSEVHLVLRNHGPEISGETSAQLSSFLGGCTTNFPGFSEEPNEAGECGNMMAAVFARDCN